jgi:histidinol-phosphate aminotransferase
MVLASVDGTPGTRVLARREVLDLPRYQSGAPSPDILARWKLAELGRLASNENLIGPSPLVREALLGILDDVHRYPDPNCTDLRRELAARHAVPAERIVVGNGSEDIIEMLCKAFLSRSDRVVTLAPAFGLHEIFPRMMGAEVQKVPVTSSWQFDVPAIAAALGRPTKMLMLSTPSNPVGCELSNIDVQQLNSACRPETIFVLDEAYREYSDDDSHTDRRATLESLDRPWIVLRTMSKAYGLAGLRVGYGIASDAECVSLLDRVRTPFNVNLAGQVAAIAALRDEAHLRTVVAATAIERMWLMDSLEELTREEPALQVAASAANFLFIDTGRNSKVVARQLAGNGVLVKPWMDPGFENCIRVTVGPRTSNERFVRSFGDIVCRPNS